MSGWWGRSCEEEEPEEEEAPPQGKQTIILRLSYSSIQFNSTLLIERLSYYMHSILKQYYNKIYIGNIDTYFWGNPQGRVFKYR